MSGTQLKLPEVWQGLYGLTKLQNLVVGLPADPPRLGAQPRPEGRRLSVALQSLPPSCCSLRCSTKCTLGTPGFHPTSSAVPEVREKFLLNHEKTPGFLASGEEFSPGPEMRFDCSELLFNRVLLKYKRDRESFWHRHQKGQKEYPLAIVSNGVIYSPISYYNESKECLEVVKTSLDLLP